MERADVKAEGSLDFQNKRGRRRLKYKTDPRRPGDLDNTRDYGDQLFPDVDEVTALMQKGEKWKRKTANPEMAVLYANRANEMYEKARNLPMGSVPRFMVTETGDIVKEEVAPSVDEAKNESTRRIREIRARRSAPIEGMGNITSRRNTKGY